MEACIHPNAPVVDLCPLKSGAAGAGHMTRRKPVTWYMEMKYKAWLLLSGAGEQKGETQILGS